MTSHVNRDSNKVDPKREVRERTILVPGEGISQLLSVNINVQSDGHQNFRKCGCLTQSSRVLVIIAEQGTFTHKW